MLSRATLLHLRIPFSLFLLPIFTFAVAVSPPGYEFSRLAMVFVILHLLIYPASNAYNSYMDRDTGPIGALEQPPPVTRQLFWVSLILDVLGVLLGALLDFGFALMLVGYTLVSRAYSWHGLRLKRYPWLSWAVVALFQGGYTVLTVQQGLAGWSWHDLFGGFWPGYGWALLAATLLVGGSYPLTQVYQHGEDAQRGDRTLSLVLGVRGTFLFCLAVLGLGGAVLLGYLYVYRGLTATLTVALALSPVLGHFTWWMARVWSNPAQANYRHTMRQNIVAGICLTAAFLPLCPPPTWG